MKKFSDERAYRFINKILNLKISDKIHFENFVVTTYFCSRMSNYEGMDILFQQFYPENSINKPEKVFLYHRETGPALIHIHFKKREYLGIYFLHNSLFSKQNFFLTLL